MGEEQDKYVIQVENLNKSYGKTIGVKDATFSVSRGEIFGFLGPNGAGKTTTIRLLLDLLKPDSGNILMFGKNLEQNSREVRSLCGYLPGEFQAYNHLTGKEYLALFSSYRNTHNTHLQHLLQRLQFLDEDLKRKIRQYSRGMMQKLGIIQAFMHHPQLIILDEPTSGLDPLMQEEFYRLLIEYHEAGTTFFLSSHNLAEVEKLCSSVAIIREGKIISIEAIEALRKKTGRIIHLELEAGSSQPDLPGTELISALENVYVFRLSGEPGPILKSISALPVKDIVIEKPSLENVFMQFYKNN